MSDFGSELGNSGLNVMGKLLDALMKLIAKIYDTWRERTSADYKLKKAELGEMQSKAAKRKFVEKIEGKTGFVAHKDLIRAGVPITQVGITLDDKGFKELAARCKREGIVISGVEDIRATKLSGNKNMIVECKQSDLKRLASLIDLMNDEKKIAKVQDELLKVDNQTKELQGELDNLKLIEEPSEEQLARMSEIETEIQENNGVVEALKQEISNIRTSYKEQLNQEQVDGIIEQAVTGKTYSGIDFNEAVDRWTGGEIDKDTTCYVVDAKDPEKYIVCHASNDTFRDENYIKTIYEVYHGDKQVYATNDGRFEGRGKLYWKNEKEAMQNANGMGNTVIKFYSLSEMQQFKTFFEQQKKAEIDILDAGKSGRDYDAIISSLTAKIEECGGKIQDGIIVDKETEKPLVLAEDMNDNARAAVAEATIAGKQIKNYKEIKGLEEQLAIARANIVTASPEEKAVAQAKFDSVEARYNSALEVEKSLIEERNGINAVQAREEVKESEKAERSAIDRAAEKKDDRRDERVDDAENPQHTMAEYKGAIEDKRAEGAKQIDVTDKTQVKEKAKAAVPKTQER